MASAFRFVMSDVEIVFIIAICLYVSVCVAVNIAEIWKLVFTNKYVYKIKEKTRKFQETYSNRIKLTETTLLIRMVKFQNQFSTQPIDFIE